MPKVSGAKMDSRTRRFFGRTQVAGVMEDARGRIAVATNNHGIYLYDQQADSMAYLCGSPGMANIRT